MTCSNSHEFRYSTKEWRPLRIHCHLKVRIAQNRNILHFWYDCTSWWPSGLVPSRICGCDRPMSFKKNKKNLLIAYIHRVIILSWSWFAEEKNYFQNKGVKKQLGAYKITDRVREADSRWDFEEWLPQSLFRIDLPREWLASFATICK